MDIIYCAGRNRQLMQIAYESRIWLGVCSGLDDYGLPIEFVDIDYKKPHFERHLAAVAKHQPKYATVPDLSETIVSEVDVERAIKQAEILANYCQTVLIVPKLSGQIAMLPDNLALGYSVPTRYGGIKTIPVWEFANRRIHLLGGSPHDQMEIYRYLSAIATVTSADGNMAQLIAIKFAKFWQAPGQWVGHPKRGQGIKDLYLDCWRRSCQNIFQEWEKLCQQPPL